VRSKLAKALWLAWPLWVGFAVISTGNHYWLDVAAGFVLALLTGLVLSRTRLLRLRHA
jgi:membrane-associated phospholipid phosphatase